MVPMMFQAITTVTTQQRWQRKSPKLREALVTTNVSITNQSLLSLDTGMLKSVLHIYSCQADEENHICSDEWNDWRHICRVLCCWWHVHLSGFHHEQAPFHGEMSYYRLQLKQPQPLTACLAHLSLQVGHEVKKRVGKKRRFLRKTSGTCEDDGKRSDLIKLPAWWTPFKEDISAY